MTIYSAPTRDTLFLLSEVICVGNYSHIEGYEELSAEVLSAVIGEAGRFAAEVVAPLNGPGDIQGCTRHSDGTVTSPDGYAEAYRQFHDGGWGNLALPREIGGQGLPALLSVVQNEYLCSASPAFSMFAGGPAAIAEVLLLAASPEIQAKYLPRLVSGEWTGTMNLTEPHCGSDVGLIRTRAEPVGDDTYKITGNKIFISLGESDHTDNILHLVLARTPGAPASTRGISLFLVPKFLVNEDGSLGERNAVICSAIERKMGLHGSPTCAMDYDGATGWMIGHENKGLAAMFILMNSARLSVGIQGLALAEIAYQNAAAYALERRQGRALTGPVDPDQPADPIIVHPDVRRMLMDARAFIAPMRALTLWCGLLVDLSRRSPDLEEREASDKLLSLLIPILKGYGTEQGLRVTIDMQQIWGGHGYIVDNGMEQFVRDLRIALIYEGTTGIQAMDLVGRKLRMDDGEAIKGLLNLIEAECASSRAWPELAGVADSVEGAMKEMKHATGWLARHGIADLGAGSFYYLELAGIVVLGLMWLRIGQAAARGLESGAADPHFYQARLSTAQYFADKFVPDANALRQKIEKGAASLMALPDDGFGVL